MLRTKSNKQIVPRRVLEFTPLINAVTEDLIQHMRDSRGLDNSVEDVMGPLMDWSFEGGVGSICTGDGLMEYKRRVDQGYEG